MQIEGSMLNNMKAAAKSAQRLRGKRVYQETMDFWIELAAEGRRIVERYNSAELDELDELVYEIVSVEREIKSRNDDRGREHLTHS